MTSFLSARPTWAKFCTLGLCGTYPKETEAVFYVTLLLWVVSPYFRSEVTGFVSGVYNFLYSLLTGLFTSPIAAISDAVSTIFAAVFSIPLKFYSIVTSPFYTSSSQIFGSYASAPYSIPSTYSYNESSYYHPASSVPVPAAATHEIHEESCCDEIEDCLDFEDCGCDCGCDGENQVETAPAPGPAPVEPEGAVAETHGETCCECCDDCLDDLGCTCFDECCDCCEEVVYHDSLHTFQHVAGPLPYGATNTTYGNTASYGTSYGSYPYAK